MRGAAIKEAAEACGGDRKVCIKRLGTAKFEELRKMETGEGKGEMSGAGAWSKMAIVRVNRRETEKSRCVCRECTTETPRAYSKSAPDSFQRCPRHNLGNAH